MVLLLFVNDKDDEHGDGCWMLKGMKMLLLEDSNGAAMTKKTTTQKTKAKTQVKQRWKSRDPSDAVHSRVHHTRAPTKTSSGTPTAASKGQES